jgi:mannose-6-phosphate isomerase
MALPPHEPIGEALLTAPEAIVSSGELAGLTLGELVQQAPHDWLGPRGFEATGGRHLFPLLCKLLDTRTNLSIQVHPNDAQAGAAGLGTGKSEAYHILAAEPGSVLFLGLRPDIAVADFADACRLADGSAAKFLRQICHLSPRRLGAPRCSRPPPRAAQGRGSGGARSVVAAATAGASPARSR